MKWLIMFLPLIAFAQSPNSNLVEWDLVPNALGITVWAKPGECGTPGTYAQKMPELPGDAVAYTDTNLAEPFQWCYYVTARYPGGVSGPSNEAGKAPKVVNVRAR